MGFDRRAQDAVVQKLVVAVDEIRKEMKDNTELTREIRGIVSGFRIIGRVAKWLTYVIGLVVAAFALVKGGIELNQTVESAKIINPGK